jgi:hypothetical protein
MRETFPPAIKHLANDSLSASQQAARTLFASQEPAEDLNQVRDKRLDLTIEAFFKVAVLQARRTESVTDVAALWEDTTASMPKGWRCGSPWLSPSPPSMV